MQTPGPPIVAAGLGHGEAKQPFDIIAYNDGDDVVVFNLELVNHHRAVQQKLLKILFTPSVSLFRGPLGLKMQKAHFEEVMDTDQGLRQIERPGDEILGPGLQGAKTVIRLSGNHEDREVAVGLDLVQSLEDLEAIHYRHLNVQQDQGITVLLVHGTDPARVRGGCDASVASTTQHLGKKNNMVFLVVHDQDTCIENVR